jgi:hypothetical protein
MRAAERVFCTVVAALVCATASAQLTSAPSETPRMSVEFRAESMQYDAAARGWHASRACKVIMKVEGKYEGTMESPALATKGVGLRGQGVTARGPVTLRLVIVGEEGTAQVELTATCTDEAILNTTDETLVLQGNATAEVRSLGQGEAQTEHFAGDSIALNLKTKQITVTNTIPGCSSEVVTP